MSNVKKNISQLTEEDFIKAFELFEVEGKNFPASISYDISWQGNNYPPKPIIALAYKNHYGEVIQTTDFGQGKDSKEFKLIEKLGFEIVQKKPNKEYLESQLKFTNTQNSKINFVDFLTKFDTNEINSYIDLIRGIVTHFQINIGDHRFVFNYDELGFYFTVGQRYSLVYMPKSSEAKFFIASTEKIGNLGIDKQFDGPPVVYFSRRNDLFINDNELSYVYDAVKVEISRSKKSRYYKSNKQDFENYIFEGLVSTSIPKSNLIEDFIQASSSQNLHFSSYLTKRYIASLATKPFVIFTGLSGSGKTKLAQTFAQWICEDESQYKIIPVGADWTNREPLLGYPNSLDSKNYVLPDNGALELVLNAIKNASDNTVDGELNVSACKPFFLILDEMNLSHVERYFADFLSAMESKEIISLYAGDDRKDQIGNNIPQGIVLPPNLFVVGTVNIDETTYMFSPKVLDRANTIEFRVDSKEMNNFFAQQSQNNSDTVSGQGSKYKDFFMQLVSNSYPKTNKYQSTLIAFFRELQALGAEFGYRTANEMINLMQRLEELGVDSSKNENELDVAVMQKLLPKLHGSRTKLVKTLPVLASFCIQGIKLEDAKIHLDSFKNNRLLTTEQEKQLLLPLSFYKIARMYANAIENGFASYAEG